jgi:hypothetical protein
MDPCAIFQTQGIQGRRLRKYITCYNGHACFLRESSLQVGKGNHCTPVEYIGHVDLLGMMVDKDGLFH